MRGMREYEWQSVVNKILFYGNGIWTVNIQVANYEYIGQIVKLVTKLKWMKFVKIFPKKTYVFMNDKEKNLRSYNIIESWSGEVIWVTNIIIIGLYLLSLVPLPESNMTVIKVGRW